MTTCSSSSLLVQWLHYKQSLLSFADGGVNNSIGLCINLKPHVNTYLRVPFKREILEKSGLDGVRTYQGCPLAMSK